MLYAAKMQDSEYVRLRRPRELETGISEKIVVYKCFFCDSKYLRLGIEFFNSKIRLESNAAS